MTTRLDASMIELIDQLTDQIETAMIESIPRPSDRRTFLDALAENITEIDINNG